MPARKDAPEETKGRLLATRAGLDMTSLLHEVVLCQERLDETARRRQPLVIKKRGSSASQREGSHDVDTTWIRLQALFPSFPRRREPIDVVLLQTSAHGLELVVYG